jgi:hypothetical protein
MADPPIFVDGQPATAAMLQALGSEISTYTPTLTGAAGNPVLGSGSESAGAWWQLGPLVFFKFSIQFGSSGASFGSGQWRVAAPPVPVLLGSLSKMSLGQGRVIDNNVGTDFGSAIIELEALDGDPTKFVMAVEEGVTVTPTVPFTFQASDRLFGGGFYPGDF